MHVVLGLCGQVVVHHVLDFLHIDAACEHVGGNQYVGGAVGEVLKGATTLVLAAAGVDGLNGVPNLLQAAARGVRAAARAAEHDDAPMAALLHEALEQLGFHCLLHVHDVLLHRVGSLALVGDLDHGGVVQQLAGRAHDGAVDGGAEQQGLTVLRRGADDFAHGRPETHVEHAVGLVEHEHFHAAQMSGSLVHKVHQTARRGDEHVDAAVERLDLRVVGNAADHGEDAMVRVLRDGAAHLADLLGELARGGDHQHERALVALGVTEFVHGGQAERGGFARAGLRGGDQVAALEHLGDGLFLHRGGGAVTQLGHSLQCLARKAEVVEMRHVK